MKGKEPMKKKLGAKERLVKSCYTKTRNLQKKLEKVTALYEEECRGIQRQVEEHQELLKALGESKRSKG